MYSQGKGGGQDTARVTVRIEDRQGGWGQGTVRVRAGAAGSQGKTGDKRQFG